MNRRVVALALTLCAIAGSSAACKGAKGPAISTATTAAAIVGPLNPALLSATQLQRVPGLSTATIKPILNIALLRDPDPRGACGGKVPVFNLDDAVGNAWQSQTIRGGSQVVLREPAGNAKAYLDARRLDSLAECPEYTVKNAQALDQVVRLEAIVELPRGNEQTFAVVNAIKIGDVVRAQTVIEVRRGDVLSRAVLLSAGPLANQTIRGIGALMGKALLKLT